MTSPLSISKASIRSYQNTALFSYAKGWSKKLDFSVSAEADFSGAFFVHPWLALPRLVTPSL
jgi:hypothetical protein